MSAQFDAIEIWIEAFIPMASVKALDNCFKGDDRAFSSDRNGTSFRARSEIYISGIIANASTFSESHTCGETQRLDCDTLEPLEVQTASTDGMKFHHFQVGNTFPDPEGGVIDNPNEFCINFLYDGVAGNPLASPSPDIDMNFFFTIDPINQAILLHGAVNAFPDYEAYASVDGGLPVVLFQHAHSLDPAFGLPGGADQQILASVQF